MNDLGTLPGFSTSQATDINDNGQVVGYAQTSDGNSRDAFLYSNGTMTDLGALPTGSNPAAFKCSINASGQVVGTLPNGHAFLYSNGTRTDLGTVPGYSQSIPTDINDNGQVVGNAEPDGYYPFLYSNGMMVDLNSLIDPASGWTLDSATAINDSGQIVGWGDNSLGQGHAFLLTPVALVPEPSTLVLLLMGAIALAGYPWRRRAGIAATR